MEDRVVGVAGRPRAAPRPAARRFPLLAGALLSLIAGLWGALGLLDAGVPVPRTSFAQQHGPLMALGFLGTLISLERGVALGRPWAYISPALAGLGALTTAAGLTVPGRLLLTAAGGWLVAVYIAVLGRRTGRDLAVQASGAVAWYTGGLLWIGGRTVAEIVPWLAAFLVLTIAGERLELARVAFLGRRASDGLLGAAALIGAGAAASTLWPDAGWRLTGLGMAVLAGWLAVHDIARRTVRSTGLPRYAAACLLAGYLWLAVAGTIWLAAGRPSGGLYDAALHAVFLGFVMSMVFGHAPVILPAVLRVRLPYHPVLYAPLVLLHASLLVRVVGDVSAATGPRTLGGVLGEVSLLLFGGCAVAASRLPRGEPS
ncbi:hypothetical protein [Actinomadura madurae]|uniref:hypothetical protein n=2 Tax=Actinomadura madurae TaxID=1993 RepID=UPI002026F240|nr:hypothetical protein [Actinomadura madurae]MCP9949897.1 hypothetical protein [Actinomadura madurae]MCP9966649.1 hypothetical protein [Actinomadura madurae]MCQ0009332.1 hypothetical protein [Actinomadura madurae]MCQ0015328.1 hypothetical protein [Actinomadura madurae]URN06163.1 hypothetical protein LUW74_24490 [Actinomadura madurae]